MRRTIRNFLPCLANVAVGLLCSSVVLAQGGIVINEYSYDDSSTDDLQFVELYNASGAMIDISGYVIASNDPSGTNADFTPAGGIPAGTMLAPGGFYVVGDPAVPNVNLLAAATLENDNESIELYDASGALLDASIYEANKGVGFASAAVLAQANVGYWGNVTLIESTFQATSRWRDGRDTDTNGRDFGLIPWTPGASNNLPANPAYQIPDVDPAAVGSDVLGMTGSFVNPKVIDPTLADTNNPNAIPLSPQGGNASIAWDSSGGGNTSASNELADQFLISAYLDTTPFGESGGEQTTYGLGTTDTFHNFANPYGDFLPPGVTANGNIGVGWFYEKEDSAGIVRLSLIDFGKGGDSQPGTDWTIHATVDLSNQPSDWYTLGIDYDPATGDVVATFDGQVFMFNTDSDQLGTFYTGYRESLAGVPVAKLRPPTFDLVPEPSSIALVGFGLAWLMGRMRRS